MTLQELHDKRVALCRKKADALAELVEAKNHVDSLNKFIDQLRAEEAANTEAYSDLVDSEAGK